MGTFQLSNQTMTKGATLAVALACSVAIAFVALPTFHGHSSNLNSALRSPSRVAHPGRMVSMSAVRSRADRNAIHRSIAQARRNCIRNAVGLFYSTQTGNTETVAGKIGEACGLSAQEIGDVSVSSLGDYDGLIVGAPTWHTDADEERSGTSWTGSSKTSEAYL